MSLAPKIVVHSPVSNVEVLKDFVERCLVDKVALIAIVGPGCRQVEDLIDEIIVGDGLDTTRFICTTSHPEESVEEVLRFARNWALDEPGDVQEIVL